MKKFDLIAGMLCLLIAQVHGFAVQAASSQTMQQGQETVKPHAHVHGSASLQVAVDGNTLTLNLESPLDNLIGFEHMPRTEKQRAAVRDMVARLNKAGTLFVPTLAARCASESVKLASPVLEPENKTASEGHADLDAEFIFRCQRPDALRDLAVKLFDEFPNLRQLDVQIASSRGQSAAKLSSTQRRITW